MPSAYPCPSPQVSEHLGVAAQLGAHGVGAGRSRGDLVARRELGDLDSGFTTTS